MKLKYFLFALISFHLCYGGQATKCFENCKKSSTSGNIGKVLKVDSIKISHPSQIGSRKGKSICASLFENCDQERSLNLDRNKINFTSSCGELFKPRKNISWLDLSGSSNPLAAASIRIISNEIVQRLTPYYRRNKNSATGVVTLTFKVNDAGKFDNLIVSDSSFGDSLFLRESSNILRSIVINDNHSKNMEFEIALDFHIIDRLTTVTDIMLDEKNESTFFSHGGRLIDETLINSVSRLCYLYVDKVDLSTFPLSSYLNNQVNDSVKVELIISMDGRIKSASIIDSSLNDLFNKVVVEELGKVNFQSPFETETQKRFSVYLLKSNK